VTQLDVVVVDGSPAAIAARHRAMWPDALVHVRPDPDLRCANGKVAGVLTGLRRARHERVLLADDDVRYDAATLAAILARLDRPGVGVVRPQNVFEPRPWHALWDTSRTLLNRVSGGDWPGTLAVRRQALLATGGYDGDVLFENLELVRTVRAAGWREEVALDVLVPRRPPSTGHFLSQRVRQAYDELARPVRLAVWLSVVPATAAHLRHPRRLLGGVAAVVLLAEVGRRRAGGRPRLPATASLLAPGWVLERGVCAWLAVGLRVGRGGVPYREGVLRRAATPVRVLRRRYAAGRATVAVPGASLSPSWFSVHTSRSTSTSSPSRRTALTTPLAVTTAPFKVGLRNWQVTATMRPRSTPIHWCRRMWR